VSGTLDILSVGDGHLTLKFDKADPIELERARRAVTTLLRSGCILFADIEGKTTRILDFDANTDSYIIADVSDSPQGPPKPADSDVPESNLGPPPNPNAIPKKGKRGRKKSVPAADVKVTSVPIRAGG